MRKISINVGRFPLNERNELIIENKYTIEYFVTTGMLCNVFIFIFSSTEYADPNKQILTTSLTCHCK